jgi:hypothetical protein
VLTVDHENAKAAWLSIAYPLGGGTHMRVAERGDGSGLVVDAVYVHGPEVTASTLQGIPVSHLAVAAAFADSLFAFLTVLKYGGFRYPVSVEQGGGEPSLAELRELESGAPASLRLIEQMKKQRPTLTRPDGSDPDGFADRVAEAYREYVMETRSPALKIAEEAGVPVGTARGWIREARRRGKLPQGRKGKAG